MAGKRTYSEDYVSGIVDLFADSVYRFALLYLRNPHDAEDASQEVFTKLFRSGRTFPDDHQAKAWLMKVTSNHCKDVLKSGWRRKTVFREPAADDDEVDDGEAFEDTYAVEKSEVVRLVMDLPEIYRHALYLHYYDDYSVLEITKILGISEGALKSRLKRGRELLKLKSSGQEDLS